MTCNDNLKIMILSPDLDETVRIGGIISVVKTILSVLDVEYKVFVRSPRKTSGVLKRFIGLLKLYFDFLKIVLSQRYRIFHIHTVMNFRGLLRDFIWIKIIGSFSNSKIVTHLHGGEYLFKIPSSWISRFLVGSVLSNSDRIIVLSNLEKASLSEKYKFEQKIFVLENCINLDQIPNEYRKLNEIDKSEVKIVFLGRISENKGINEIIRAIQLLDKKTTNFQFHLYGDGELKDEIILKLKHLLKHRFIYHGIVSGKRKWEALYKSDIFLLPSRYGEGLPMAILEAMALGKIVIVTDDASIGLVVKDNINGFMTEKYNSEVLFERIYRVFQMETEDLKSISSNAQQTIINKFSQSVYKENLNKIYKTLGN